MIEKIMSELGSANSSSLEDNQDKEVSKKVVFRTQFSPRLETPRVDWPDSIVQAGLCPSISQMVRTRSVGGQIDEYEMDGIVSDAPFDSEYVDFFDMADAAAELEAEREASKQPALDSGAPPKTDPKPSEPPSDGQQDSK